jgi:hypothetical protein
MQEDLALEFEFQKHNFLCHVCKEPYKNAYIYPLTKEIRCKNCWKDSENSKYWSHDPINDKMEQIKLLNNLKYGLVDEKDLDVQNEIALSAVLRECWEEVIDNFKRNAERRCSWVTWKNMSKYILVEACERPNCPESIIEYLITDAGPNMFFTRPCINPHGIGAMTPIAIAAEKGNMNALRVFIRSKRYACFGQHWSAVCAFNSNQGEAFDFLLDTYVDKSEDIRSTLQNDFPISRMIEDGIQKNLDQSLRVIKKYFSDTYSKLEAIEPW